ncbi:hypothetical protein [uncultured Tateyamaria sp.]|uniref:hypothetical protein n=1 Tax=Tateyamaria sp. 1078 TaxID=3417464 RepID=UPI002625B77D|nr:hypothetical protein [uncultured Tateyamaria sp.]
MRDFLVRSLNTIIWLVFSFMVIGTLVGATLAFFEAAILGVIVLLAGLVASVFVAGTCFLATGLYELSLGIYNNTTRTANALEILAGAPPDA